MSFDPICSNSFLWGTASRELRDGEAVTAEDIAPRTESGRAAGIPPRVKPEWWHGEPLDPEDVRVAMGCRRVAAPRRDASAMFSERNDKRCDRRRGETGDLQHMRVYLDIVRPVVLRTGLYPCEHEERAREDATRAASMHPVATDDDLLPDEAP